MESFFKTLKFELVHQQTYETRAQARTDLVNCIERCYNRQRIHSSIGYAPPIDAECGLMAA
jgi:transposase InsO family protein